MIRVLIADDHPIVRRGLEDILSDESDFRVGGSVENARQVLELVRKQPWDVVVLDISMPGMSGLELLDELLQLRPALPVLMLSMQREDQYAVRVLKAGARGFVSKDSAPQELVKAIRKVVQGGRYVSPSLAEQLALDLQRDTSKPPHELLSKREFQVMRLIASGKSVSQVADHMSLSVKTISTYRKRILEKMKMENNAELTRYSIAHCLIDDLI